MEENKIFFDLRDRILECIFEKNIDLNLLALKLGVDKNTFINYLTSKIDDFTFYLQALSLVEHWEV